MPRVRDPRVLRRTAALFAAALAVRVAAAAVFGIGGPPVEDEIDYVAIAESVARGEGLQIPDALLPARTAFRPPLLPLLLAPVVSLGGGVLALRCVSIVVGALAAPLAYRALRRTSLGEAALWVGAALAVWPPSVYLSLRVLAEPLAMALMLLCLAVTPDAADTSRSARKSFLAGALAGLSVLARPGGLFAAGFLAFARGTWRGALVFLVGLALALAPWVARNWALHGRPLLTTHTGVTLVGANSQAAADAEWPGKWLPPRVVYPPEEAPDAGPARAVWQSTLSDASGMWGWRDLTEEASDRRFTADALGWVREHPGDASVLVLWKLVRLFDPDQHSGKDDAPLKRFLGWATFGPVLVLAAAGLVVARRDRTLRPWLLVLAGTVATTAVFYGDVRMRNPADPSLLAFAAAAVVRLRERLRPSAGAPPAGR